MQVGSTGLGKEKQKLIARARRIRGQADAITRALESDDDCATILQQLSACRGAIAGLMAEVLEHHVQEHIGKGKPSPEVAEDIVEIVRAYLK
jgi:DNA-binding FrmR family transcriptional regulator